MNGSNELEILRAKVADLEARVTHDDESRRQLLANTDELMPRLAKERQQWETLFTAHRENLEHQPEFQQMREQALLPKFAQLATRQRALEEQYFEMCGVIITTLDLAREILESLKGDRGNDDERNPR
jgi:hypothetical protein